MTFSTLPIWCATAMFTFVPLMSIVAVLTPSMPRTSWKSMLGGCASPVIRQ